ncbi:uncharacterized protein V3H82_017231 [Fundulus diaphanus]
MEESYETFEEELWPPRADAPPQRPVRQIRRASGGTNKNTHTHLSLYFYMGVLYFIFPFFIKFYSIILHKFIMSISEMYTARKIREEVPPVPLQPRSEPKTLPREPSFTKLTTLHKTLSIQNLTQVETPWENVTLNRCLFVAIAILVLTSGFQRLHETLRSQGAMEEEEEAGLTMRRSRMLRHRGHLPEPETSLWEVMFWWLPDLDDEDEEEDDGEEIKGRKSKRDVTTRPSRGLRNRPLPEKKLLKQRDGKLRDRRARKARANKIKGKRGRVKKEDPEGAANEEDERDEETEPKKNKLDGK